MVGRGGDGFHCGLNAAKIKGLRQALWRLPPGRALIAHQFFF